jgi:hypothetical protein
LGFAIGQAMVYRGSEMRKKWSCGFGLKDLAFMFEHERRHREAEARFKRREELKRIARDFAVNPEIEKIRKEEK